jgi:hypothetical protein
VVDGVDIELGEASGDWAGEGDDAAVVDSCGAPICVAAVAGVDVALGDANDVVLARLPDALTTFGSPSTVSMLSTV